MNGVSASGASPSHPWGPYLVEMAAGILFSAEMFLYFLTVFLTRLAHHENSVAT